MIFLTKGFIVFVFIVVVYTLILKLFPLIKEENGCDLLPYCFLFICIHSLTVIKNNSQMQDKH